MIGLNNLFYGTVILDENNLEYMFVNHCFCTNNIDPEISLFFDGEIIEKKLSEIENWKILN